MPALRESLHEEGDGEGFEVPFWLIGVVGVAILLFLVVRTGDDQGDEQPDEQDEQDEQRDLAEAGFGA